MRDADTEKITLRLPARYLKALDFLVQVDDFPSRSEAVRFARLLRDALAPMPSQTPLEPDVIFSGDNRLGT